MLNPSGIVPSGRTQRMAPLHGREDLGGRRSATTPPVPHPQQRVPTSSRGSCTPRSHSLLRAHTAPGGCVDPKLCEQKAASRRPRWRCPVMRSSGLGEVAAVGWPLQRVRPRPTPSPVRTGCAPSRVRMRTTSLVSTARFMNKHDARGRRIRRRWRPRSGWAARPMVRTGHPTTVACRRREAPVDRCLASRTHAVGVQPTHGTGSTAWSRVPTSGIASRPASGIARSGVREAVSARARVIRLPCT